MPRSSLALSIALLLVGTITAGRAAEPVAGAEEPPSPGQRHALVIVGHPGDAEHVPLYAETAATLRAALTEQWGFASENVHVLFGSGPPEDGEFALGDARPATREEIEATVAALRRTWTADDAVWVIAIGHAYYDGRTASFNLPGPDLSADEFARLFTGIEPREQAFWITTSVSGFFIKPLSAEGRVVITATEADWETNETVFPHALASVLSESPVDADLDADGDGRLSLFDLYIAVARRTMQQYVDSTSVPTEHAQLDDNGDRRGTELQLDYLPEELGGRAVEGVRPTIPKGADGELAGRIALQPRRVERSTEPADPEPVEAPIPPAEDR